MMNSDNHGLEHFHESQEENCIYCRYNFECNIPEILIESIINNKAIIFAGAGITTENPNVYPSTLYTEVVEKLKLSNEIDFPEAMQKFEEENSRRVLIEKIFSRIKYVEDFDSLKHASTRFHTALSTIPQFKNIITTNWDDFFEKYCGSIPIVTDEDYALSDIKGRKVYKFHGSINNISSIIATTSDYQECENSLQRTAIGGTLRHLLATNTVIFIGYSLTDSDFQNVFQSLINSMGKSRPVCYFVSPFENAAIERYDLRFIKTDGTYFLDKIKDTLIKSKNNIPDEALHYLLSKEYFVDEFIEEISDSDWGDHPLKIFSLFRATGVRDFIKRLKNQMKTGDYSLVKRVQEIYHSYKHIVMENADKQNWTKASYFDGYRLGYLFLLEWCNDNKIELDESCLHEYFLYLDLPDNLDTSDDIYKYIENNYNSLYKSGESIVEEYYPKYTPNISPFL